MRHKYTLFRRKKGARVWYFYYYDQDGQRKARSTGKLKKFEAETEAEKFLAELESPQRRVRLADFARGFFDQAGPWVQAQHERDHGFSAKQSVVRAGHLDNWVIPTFGDRWMDGIEAYEVEQWLRGLALANGTKNAIISTMALLFREALFQKYIEADPMVQIRRFSDRYQPRDALTIEDIRELFPRDRERLLALWGYPKWATLYYTMLTTGMRRGEAAALQWCHVIWERRGLVVLQAVKGGGHAIGPPKSGDERAVLLPARTLAMLRWWHEQTLFPDPEHFVFYGGRGEQYLCPDTITRRFRQSLEAAGFAPGGRTITVHSLRHTYNTRLEKVLPGEILRYMVGHKKEAMTERYLHVTPEERLEEFAGIRKQIGKAWS